MILNVGLLYNFFMTFIKKKSAKFLLKKNSIFQQPLYKSRITIRSNWTLAEPRQRTLSGRSEGQTTAGSLQHRHRLRRDRGRSARHVSQTRRDLSHNRAPLTRHSKSRVVRTPTQRTSKLDHSRQSAGRRETHWTRCCQAIQGEISRRQCLAVVDRSFF